MLLTRIPDPALIVVPVWVKLAPVRTTEVVPKSCLGPLLGEIEASVGADGLVVVGLRTVKVTVPVVPPAVVMLTVLAETVAAAEIVKVAVTVVLLTTVMPLTATPVPDTFTDDVVVRLVPVKVTGTTVLSAPEFGAIEVRVGAATVEVNSIAPASTWLSNFRWLPKKSRSGANE